MEHTRSSNINPFIWVIIIMLTILGIIVTIFDSSPQNFPEEDESHPDYSMQLTENTLVAPEELTNTQTTTPDNSTTMPHQSSALENVESTEPEIVPEITDEPESTITQDISTNITGTIYLTFDDGPSHQITTQVLDILKANNIKATFFIVDYQIGSTREEIVIRAFNEGHTIGLHGTSHTYSKIYSSLEALIDNFKSLQEKVYVSTGYRSNIIRFPGGSSNTVSKKYCQGVMTQAIEYFSSTDFLYFDWNADSQDAGGASSAAEVFENVTSSIKPGRDNIVLMHDASDKSHTLEALQSIIDWCVSEGYEFKAITVETPQVVHKIAN